MRLLVVPVLLALVLAGCAAPGFEAQDVRRGQIDGAVVDGMLRPYEDAVVRLVELKAEERTTELGGFSFRGVPAGKYTLRAEVDGMPPQEQNITVYGEQTTKTILQVMSPPEERPYVASLKHVGKADLGLPGQTCVECRWRASLQERPDHLELQARWDGDLLPGSGSPTKLVVGLYDDTGRLIARVAGESPLEARIRGSALPAGTDGLEVRVTFHHDNEVPHPAFRVQTRLCLYHGLQPGQGYGCV